MADLRLFMCKASIYGVNDQHAALCHFLNKETLDVLVAIFDAKQASVTIDVDTLDLMIGDASIETDFQLETDIFQINRHVLTFQLVDRGNRGGNPQGFPRERAR